MKPIEELVQRNIINEDYKSLLQELSESTEELVNFGSNIIAWLMEMPNETDAEIPCILFLRNFLDELDGISILIKYSSIDCCNNLLRTTLENFFYLEYILEKNTKERSMSFLAWNAIRNRKYYLKIDGQSQDFKNFESMWKKDKFLKNVVIIKFEDIDIFKKNNVDLLNHPSYKPYEIEYENIKKTTKNPEWFSLFNGPKNLQELANYLNYQGFYEIFYRNWSSSIHGTDIYSGKFSSTFDNKLALHQIRLPSNNCITITQICFHLSTIVYKKIIENKIPDKLKIYNNWYTDHSKLNQEISKINININQ